MSSYDDNSYDTSSYSIYSFSFPDYVYAGWREIKKFTLTVVRSINNKVNIR